MKAGMIVKVVRPSFHLSIGQSVEVLKINGDIVTVKSGFSHIPVNKRDIKEINIKR